MWFLDPTFMWRSYSHHPLCYDSIPLAVEMTLGVGPHYFPIRLPTYGRDICICLPSPDDGIRVFFSCIHLPTSCGNPTIPLQFNLLGYFPDLCMFDVVSFGFRRVSCIVELASLSQEQFDRVRASDYLSLQPFAHLCRDITLIGSI